MERAYSKSGQVTLGKVIMNLKKLETKELILQTALDFSSKLGLESLSIGTLAKKVGMSKSGLFGHFNSKEKLQIMVLDYAAENFVNNVFKPSFKKARGLPRLEAIVTNWLSWSDKTFTGGCPLISAGFEYDDRPGDIRNIILKYQDRMIESFKTTAEQAKEEGHFHKDLDTEQFAFEFYSLMLGYHLYHRLLKSENARKLHQNSFNNLIERSK